MNGVRFAACALLCIALVALAIWAGYELAAYLTHGGAR